MSAQLSTETPTAALTPAQEPAAGGGEPTKPASRSGGGRLAALDGLRLLAALGVMAYHFLAMGTAWGRSTVGIFPTLHVPASYGWLGVQLFFLISGFVICMSAWGRSLGQFFVSRVVRLYPAYWFGVLVTGLVLLTWHGVHAAPGLRDIMVNLTMLQEPLGRSDVDSVYWSLWIEVCFYLLFSFVVWRGLTYRRVLAFSMIWLVAAVLCYQSQNPLLQTVVDSEYAPYFIAGMCFYLMHRFGANLVLLGMIGVCFTMGQIEAYQTYLHTERAVLGRAYAGWPVFALELLFFLLIGAVALGWIPAVRWKWLTLAGALTYPLYLLHEEIGWAVIDHFRGRLSPSLLIGCVSAAMILLAWTVHRVVEKPVARVLKRAMNRAVAEFSLAARVDR